MTGKAGFRLIDADIICPGILGDEIKTSIGSIGLGVNRQEFSLLTQYIYNIPANKAMPKISYQNQIIIPYIGF